MKYCYVTLISQLLLMNNPLFTDIFLLHTLLNWFLRMASFMSRNV